MKEELYTLEKTQNAERREAYWQAVNNTILGLQEVVGDMVHCDKQNMMSVLNTMGTLALAEQQKGLNK